LGVLVPANQKEGFIFMKRTVKKLAAVGLTLTTVMGLVACGSTVTTEPTTSKVITKPTGFTVMVDGTVVKETNGAQQFYDYLNSLNGQLNIKWIRPDHAAYYDSVANAFNSEDTRPDVVLLSSDYLTLYAANGFLWDMTDAYNNSELKSSGRLVAGADKLMEALKVGGEDGALAMYGFAPARGNGTVTYVKEQWLKDIGMTAADVSGTMTFATYYDMLKKMAAKEGKTVISSAGYIGPEVPYTNYLPEFYQQAQYTFYKNSAGQYVDGFTEQAMKDALARLATAVKDGVLDKGSVTYSTTNARDKFYSDGSGVFTYWAGAWAETIRQNLVSHNLPDTCIAIKPIKELGTYIERVAPSWAITAKAENPEGIFKYFLETMLDGSDIQTAWEYGAKGTHWDTKAETVTIKGKETAGVAYTEGQFHMLASIETPTSLMTKNFIDPTLALGSYPNGDPGKASITKLALDGEAAFNLESTVATLLPMTDKLGAYIVDINKERNNVIAAVANGTQTVDVGMAEYNTKVGTLVKEVLASYK